MVTVLSGTCQWQEPQLELLQPAQEVPALLLKFPLLLKLAADMSFLTSTLWQSGQATSSFWDRTSSSNSRPHWSQLNSYMGMGDPR
jgi:hypothetical protein